MEVHTVSDLGAAVRGARIAHGMTQADLAERLSVSRRWVVRLEQGNPRLEVQLVLDALAAVGLRADLQRASETADEDPFAQVFATQEPLPEPVDGAASGQTTVADPYTEEWQ